jgi:hypothetical protein
MDPTRVEAIDHFSARPGSALRHSLADEKFRPLLARNGNRFDGASESAAQCRCKIIGRILFGTSDLDVPDARPLLTQDLRPNLPDVSCSYQREFAIQRIRIREDFSF